jgi:hypothetical protein
METDIDSKIRGQKELYNRNLGMFIVLLLLFFMSMGWDYVSELQPPTGLLFISQLTYEYREPRWNDTDREKPKNAK